MSPLLARALAFVRVLLAGEMREDNLDRVRADGADIVGGKEEGTSPPGRAGVGRQ